MEICVKLYMSLKKREGDNEFKLELENKYTTISDLLKKLSISEEAVGLISINGHVIQNKKTILKDGDEIKLFPVVCGG